MSMVARTGLAIVLSLALAACGKSSDSSPAPDQSAPAKGSAARPSPAGGPASAGAADRARPALPTSEGEADEGEDEVDDGEELGTVRPGPAMADFDRDGDGKLDEVERKAMRARRIDDLITSVDSDGDGKLSREEMTAGDDMRAKRMLRRFGRLDSNKDGSLSRDEIENMIVIGGARRNRGPGNLSGRPMPQRTRAVEPTR